jgi:glycosyl transferase family 25
MTFPIPVFVINLERDTERRRHMAATLAGLGMAAEFVTAVNGRALPPAYKAAYDRARALRVYGVEMWDTEIACFLSHRGLFERMVAGGVEVALVLEDDVHLEPALPGVVQDLLASPFQDWLVVRLDSKRTQLHDPPSAAFAGRRVAALPGGGALYRLRTHVLGTGGYLIRREGAARMLAYGERIFMPIDHTMDRFWENGIQPYVVRPFPVLQKHEFGSSTGLSKPDRRLGQPLGMRARRRAQRTLDGVRKRVFLLRRGD